MPNRKLFFQNSADNLKHSPDLIKFQNATGFQVDIDTLTSIRKSIVEQKFYQLNGRLISDYMPIAVGENAFAQQILTYKSYGTSDSFEAGVSQGAESEASKITTSDVQIQSILVPTRYWTNELNYTLIQLGQAARAGNWGLIEEKEKARKKTWDLGTQQMAFLGLETDSSMKGLLTQSDVNSNTTVITKDISTMTASEFQTLLTTIVNAYYDNSNSTVLPDTFIMPQDDYLGLGRSVDETYPLKTMKDRLYETFRDMTDNPNFKILPLVYAQKEKNTAVLGSGSGLNRYTFMRQDSDSVLFEIPLDYTTTIMDTIQGFQYQGVAYGQFASVKAFRPLEMLYFDWS